jgi:hypothetical protein
MTEARGNFIVYSLHPFSAALTPNSSQHGGGKCRWPRFSGLIPSHPSAPLLSTPSSSAHRQPPQHQQRHQDDQQPHPAPLPGLRHQYLPLCPVSLSLWADVFCLEGADDLFPILVAVLCNVKGTAYVCVSVCVSVCLSVVIITPAITTKPTNI